YYAWSIYSQRDAEAEWRSPPAMPAPPGPPVLEPPVAPSPSPSIPPPSTEAEPKREKPKGPVTIARLWFPRLNQERFVLEGASRRNLARGPSWLEQTSRPEYDGNCVIAAHRDTHFRFLKDIATGDEIVLESGEKEYRYKVKSTEIVDPRNLTPLRPANHRVL